jgi:hypothetical protein
MHTTNSQSEPTLADLISVMIRMQIAALEALQLCMKDPESTGDEKKDRAEALKLNRKRMAATQTLLHCRTMFREIREAEAQTHRITEEKRQFAKKAKHDLAQLRRLYHQYPNEYDNPDDTVSGGGMAMQSMAMQDKGTTQNPEDIANLRMAMPPSPSNDQSADGATGGSPASAGPNEPEPQSDIAKKPAVPPKPLTPLEAHEAELKRQMAERIRKKREAMMKR